jgi:hypothetical protein
MVTQDWNRAAEREAERIGGPELFPAHRGAMPSMGRVVAFGNDGYREDAKAQAEVELLRQYCLAEGIDILGFGVDPTTGHTWAMIVDTDDVEAVDDFVWSAWYRAWCHLNKEALLNYQRSIARQTIEAACQ